jgi:hypothetical protein
MRIAMNPPGVLARVFEVITLYCCLDDAILMSAWACVPCTGHVICVWCDGRERCVYARVCVPTRTYAIVCLSMCVCVRARACACVRTWTCRGDPVERGVKETRQEMNT